MARYQSILQTIGHTPLVRLGRMRPFLAEGGVNLYVKVEAFNPMGSVKDRMALAVIEAAEASGALQPGQTVIEATSGNTGIGLAMVCARKGYPLVVTMAENFSVERRKLLRFLGAKVVLTPAIEKGTGMLNKARELASEHGYFYCDQFANEANAEVHTRTTAQEILADFQGESLDYFVSGYGTGGTLKGTARGLRAGSPTTRIIGAEPDNSPVLGSGISQRRDDDGAPVGSHPSFRPHMMQGWSPDFIAKLTQDAVDAGYIDAIIPVEGAAAMQCAQELAQQEGILVGISSGATLDAALQIAATAEPGTNIVCMLPDTGERYLSTPLFGDVLVEMDRDEIALSESTPGYQFGAAEAPVIVSTNAATSPVSKPVDALTAAFVAKVTTAHSVVVFGLPWCEFCWSVNRFFDRLGVEYHSVDLDEIPYGGKGLGGKLRAIITTPDCAPTIPQIYVDGEHVGGCTDVFDAFNAGSLQDRFLRTGITFDQQERFDAHTFAPTWQEQGA